MLITPRSPLSYVHSVCLSTLYERATPVERERNPTAQKCRHNALPLPFNPNFDLPS